MSTTTALAQPDQDEPIGQRCGKSSGEGQDAEADGADRQNPHEEL
jgi:hypothetical protein